MTDIAKKFGKRLKELRNMRKLTQSQFSELTNIEITSISRIESGTHFPKKENIEIFAKVLNVNIKELFDFRHYASKKDIIADINNMLQSADLKDIQFIQKILFSYFESIK